MTKRESKVLRAAEEYAGEIRQRFPGARTEVLLESVGGHDAWVRIELPRELDERHFDVLDATSELNERFDSESIHLIATVIEAEEVGANG